MSKQRSQLDARIHRLTLALVGMAFALDGPLYLTYTHLPWPIYPTWLLPALILTCTASGLLAAWAREMLARGHSRMLGETAATLLLSIAVPGLLAFALGHLSVALWASDYPAPTNWLASYLLLLFAALTTGMQTFLLFTGTRAASLVLIFSILIACVLLSIPGKPLQDWSMLPASISVPSVLIFDLLGFVGMTTLVVAWLRGQMHSWERRHVRVMEDAPAIASAGAWGVTFAVIAALLLPLALPRVATLQIFWQQHDPISGRVPFRSISDTGGTPDLVPGATMRLGSPDITNSSIILTWRLQSLTQAGGTSSLQAQATGQAPPLVLTTYDEFTGSGLWAQSPTTTGVVGDTLKATPDASILVATITPRQDAPTTALAAFDTSTHIAGAEPLLLASANSTLDLASWQSQHPVQSGASYTDTALLPSQSDLRAPVVGASDLSSEEYARLLEVPSVLAPTLQMLVRQWTTPNMTPLQEAQALAEGMRERYTLMTQQQTSQVDGITLLEALLRTHEGNALTWATLHVLLCREANLPARLASAYNPGTSNVDTGISTVRARDATWLTQIATTAGWLRVGPLDQVVTQPIPSGTNGANGGGARLSGAVPTPTAVGQKVSQPTTHRMTISRNALDFRSLVVLLLPVLSLCLCLSWLLLRWRRRYRREHGPLERELRWLLQSLLRAAHSAPFGAGSAMAHRGSVHLTPRQAGATLARHLPAPLAGVVTALTDRYCRLVYARTLPPPEGEPDRQIYRHAAAQAQHILKHTHHAQLRDLRREREPHV